MKTTLLLGIALFCMVQFQTYSQQSEGEEIQDTHWKPTHNFTVKRLLIFNKKNELLMEKIESNWYPPSIVFDKRQHIKESVDSLVNGYGIATKNLRLSAYLSFKYEYHPYVTLRPYYSMEYSSGELIVPEGREDVKWMPIDEVMAKTPVEAMKETIKKITEYPRTVWSGTFMVYRKGEEHHTRQEEPMFPLFNTTDY
ncbi:hypothetical protein [uncultured Croceitalea sp.]|uniref:hypothetical protein n=1 Tax=uncultured Croceitalea sp. TaxID=1798908 RepID=UPI0033060310